MPPRTVAVSWGSSVCLSWSSKCLLRGCRSSAESSVPPARGHSEAGSALRRRTSVHLGQGQIRASHTHSQCVVLCNSFVPFGFPPAFPSSSLFVLFFKWFFPSWFQTRSYSTCHTWSTTTGPWKTALFLLVGRWFTARASVHIYPASWLFRLPVIASSCWASGGQLSVLFTSSLPL